MHMLAEETNVLNQITKICVKKKFFLPPCAPVWNFFNFAALQDLKKWNKLSTKLLILFKNYLKTNTKSKKNKNPNNVRIPT